MHAQTHPDRSSAQERLRLGTPQELSYTQCGGQKRDTPHTPLFMADNVIKCSTNHRGSWNFKWHFLNVRYRSKRYLATAVTVKPSSLKVQQPDTWPHKLGQNFDLDKCTPFVFDGAVEEAELAIEIVSNEELPFFPVAALFDIKRAYTACADFEGSEGIQVVTTRNPHSLQIEAKLNFRFLEIPDHVVHVVLALVATKDFRAANSVRFHLRHICHEDDGSQSLSRLGTRQCLGAQGLAFTAFVLVRRGAWWHMYPLFDPIPNCVSRDDVISMWKELCVLHIPTCMAAAMQQQEASKYVKRGVSTMKSFLKQPALCPLIAVRRRIVFRVTEAQNLAAMDKKLFRKDSSDPYLIVTCRDETQDYAVQRNTLNPRWDANEGAPHTLPNVLASDSRCICVMMYDKDKLTKDDFMGCCSVPVAALWNLGTGIHYYNFLLSSLSADELDKMRRHNPHSYKRHKDVQVKGHITVEIQVTDEPLAPELSRIYEQLRARTSEL